MENPRKGSGTAAGQQNEAWKTLPESSEGSAHKLGVGNGLSLTEGGDKQKGKTAACGLALSRKRRLRRFLISIAAQRQTVLAQLFAHLGERGHAEVLRLQQLVGGPLDQFAQRVDTEPIHA